MARNNGKDRGKPPLNLIQFRVANPTHRNLYEDFFRAWKWVGPIDYLERLGFDRAKATQNRGFHLGDLLSVNLVYGVY
jgi:hypothetical protein